MTRFPDKLRVNSTFLFQAPECVPNEFGYYAYECETGDLLFRVARRGSLGWRNIYSASTFVYTDSYPVAGTDVTRIYYWELRGWRTRCGPLRRYRVKITLVDNFASTPDPTVVRFWRSCH